MLLTRYIVVRRTRTHICHAGRRPFTAHTGAPTQGQLILVRHGESVATEQKRFGSWMDVPLTSKGIDSARRCATLLRAEGLQLDVCYTSLLSRTIKTAWVLLEELNQMFIPVSPQWRLNERHYGNLTGLIKKEVVAQFGQEQVQIWRRSLETPPPPMTKDHFLYDQIHNSRQFKCMPYIPGSESLADVRARLIPLLQGELAQDLAAGKRVLICGHSNSLRALITLLEGVERVELKQLNIPYGFPIIYDLGTNLKPLGPRRILGDGAAVEEAYKKLFEETASLQRTSSGEA